MSFSLTDAYPIFQFNQQNVDEKYLDLFSIDHVVNKLEGDNIISTSLYFGPHYSDTLEEWEKRYIKPIIENIVFLPDGWHYEIFISPDCEKYIDRIKHPKIQFNIMKHNSTNDIPGMLWRYIPMKYSEKIIAFVGMDTPQLPHPNYIHFLNTGYKLIRWGGFVDINEHELFVYKPIRGSFLCKIEDPNIEYAMGAWIQSESHRIEISKNKTSTTINFRHVLYEGKKHKVFGTQSENCYGQDEVFLSCYLYPQYKDLSVCLINGGNHKKSAKNTAFDSDISSIKSPTIIYLNPKNSEIPKIEIKKTNICFLGSIGTSGYAIATTNFIFNYLQNNYNVTFIPRFVDNSKFDHSDIITTSVNRCKSQLYNRYDYFIINFVPDQFKNLYNEYVMYKKFIKNADCKIILQTVWETTKLPNYWVDIMNDTLIDEIWVPSYFNKKVFQESGVKTKIRIKRYISYNIITHTDKSDIIIPSHFKYGKGDITKTYNFYSISSWSDRKNYKNTIREFCKTFKNTDNVSYIIKTTLENYDDTHRETIKNEFEDILKDFPDHPTFFLFLDNYETHELNKIHNLGDCYYLLTRGEGLGLSAYDAFLNHKPVIMTKFGGQCEYFPDNYPYFVNYKLVPVDGMRNTKWYLHDHMWAEPDYEHAKKLLRDVYEKYNRDSY